MKAAVWALVLVVGAFQIVSAQSLGPSMPAKAPFGGGEVNIPRERQGGDTIESAVTVVAFPFVTTGSTAGFANDYDEVCPYIDSVAPDVVYRLEIPEPIMLDIDMCGSDYDTKIYVYDESLAVVACNDDAYSGPPCGPYTSLLSDLLLEEAGVYYLVIDGYGTAFGSYDLSIVATDPPEPPPPCEIDSSGGPAEGEPPLAIEYFDDYNGGCNTNPGHPIQSLAVVFGVPRLEGVSGWYIYHDSNYRDTDWFKAQIPSTGVLTVILDAEFETYLFELSPQDCSLVEISQIITVGPCHPDTMIVTGSPFSTAWLWVGPTTFAPPDGSDVMEYRYRLGPPLDGHDPWDLPLPLPVTEQADYSFRCPRIDGDATYLLSGHLGYRNGDYDLAGADCVTYGTPGPDAIYEVYLHEDEEFWWDINYPYAKDAVTEPDTLVYSLVTDPSHPGETAVLCLPSVWGRLEGSYQAPVAGWYYWLLDHTAPDAYHDVRAYVGTSDPTPPPAAPAHDGCAGALPLPAAPFTLSDDLTLATNQVDPGPGGCAGDAKIRDTGRDVVYEVDLTAGEILDVTMTGDKAWDEVLYLVDDCQSPVGRCAAAAVPAGDGVRLLFAAPEDGTWWLVCDSHGQGIRTFSLERRTAEVVGVEADLPTVELAPCSPNPFNPSTTVAFTVRASGPVEVAVFGMDGRQLRTLMDDFLTAGRHELTWDGRDEAGRALPSGIYLVRLDAGGEVRSQKVGLVR